MNNIASHKDLIVWQKSFQLVVEIYKQTEQFPKTEVYGLTSQMRRSAVSIVSNIAEGRRRGTKKDFRQFLSIAFGSAAELETQVEIIKHLPFGTNYDYLPVDSLLLEILKMLNKMITNLSPTS